MIKVIDIIKKPIAVSSADAKKLKNEIIKNLNNNKDDIKVSFNGIDMLISHFLNVSIGELYVEYKDKENVLDKIEYIGISDDDLELLKKRIIPSFKNPLTDKARFLNIQKDILK